MATKTSPDIDPEGQYRIVITKKIVVDDLVRLLPRNDNVIKGSLLLQIVDQVDGYEKLD